LVLLLWCLFWKMLEDIRKLIGFNEHDYIDVNDADADDDV
jgi:hypothetical protein